RHLHASHEVVVAAASRSTEEAEEGAGLAAHCAAFETAVGRAPLQAARRSARLPTRMPSSIGWFHSSRLARRIRRRLATEHFDLVFVHCSSVAHYVEHVSGIPKILDFGDMDSQKWLRETHTNTFPFYVGYS